MRVGQKNYPQGCVWFRNFYILYCLYCFSIKNIILYSGEMELFMLVKCGPCLKANYYRVKQIVFSLCTKVAIIGGLI